MITLYKGDDTGGQLGKNVKIMFHCDDAVDMDDVVVKFDLLGIVKREFTDVHDGDVLDIFISHAESRKFPLGVIFAKMWGEDASGKLRTFANRIPFRVTLNLIAVYGSDGTDSQDIHVYSSVDWDSIANKPTVFPSSVGEVEGLQGALDEINEKIPFDASADNQLADKEWVDQEIDRVAAYYITSDAQGNPFQTRAALLNAETYYSGGSPRTPTRNDYAIVLADESHDNAEWRYIYSENDQGVGVWEAQYPVEGAIVADDNVTKTSTNPVKSSGIWAAIWGALAAIPSGFTSLYDWVVAQLGHKRDYTDRSYNTQVTVNAPALHAILTSRGTQILEYYLPCTEDIPATPEINHVYTWRRDGAEFYITQGVSALITIWTLYGSEGEQLARITTDNATQGYFPALTFETSEYSAVTSTRVNSYPDEVQDTLALDSNIPAASTTLPKMDSPNAAAIGTPGKYACSDHIHPSDTSRVPTSRTINSKALSSDVTLTANDIDYSVPGGAESVQLALQGIEAALAGKQSSLSAQQLANIAAVSDALAFDATHSYAAGDPVVYNGTLYTFTAAHTGAWTGSDVSAVDIIARLAGKLDKSGGTVTGDLEVVYAEGGFKVKNNSGDYLQIRHGTVAGSFWYINYFVNNIGSGEIRLPYNSIIPADIYSLAGQFDESTTYAPNSLCIDHSHGVLYRCINPNGHTGAWVAADFAVATVEDVLAALRTAKLDSTSAAPAFSSDSSVSYPVGSHVTYNGKLYKCTTATTGGTWDASKWTADTMTDPDAVLDITAQNQLRVVAKDGTVLWAQGYDLASTSSATLACDATNNFTFADGATTQAFALPTAPTGKVGDFGLDIDNSANASAATMTLTGLDTAFSVVVPEGESLNDMLAIAAGELARFYISLSTFRVNNLQTWHIVKQIVENGGATV